jgi:hypothetical protein
MFIFWYTDYLFVEQFQVIINSIMLILNYVLLIYNLSCKYLLKILNIHAPNCGPARPYEWALQLVARRRQEECSIWQGRTAQSMRLHGVDAAETEDRVRGAHDGSPPLPRRGIAGMGGAPGTRAWLREDQAAVGGWISYGNVELEATIINIMLMGWANVICWAVGTRGRDLSMGHFYFRPLGQPAAKISACARPRIHL